MSPATCWAIVIIGAVTTLQATLSSRAVADAKSALALGAQAQVGLIFIEIGLGWDKLALWHLCAHSVLRTLEFLRAPSTLHAYHSMHAAAGGHIPATGQFYDRFIPESLRLTLYRVALDHGWVDTLLFRFFLGPLVAVVNIILMAEQRMAPIQEKGLQDD
jgi:NAD(P)H-quinone oxidoreductase subunit 5